MADVVPPFPVDAPFNSYNAVDWYQKVRRAINDAANISWSQINDFTGSNLTQLATRNHSDLQNILGASPSYHVSLASYNALTSGISVTITTAKLTGVGTNGSMTFTNGILTAQVAAT